MGASIASTRPPSPEPSTIATSGDTSAPATLDRSAPAIASTDSNVGALMSDMALSIGEGYTFKIPMRAKVRKFWKPVAVVVAMIAAFYLTFYLDGHGRSGLGVDLDPTSSAQVPAGRHRDYDLTQLHVLKHVILVVKQKYIDPARMRPRDMLLDGLDFIQRTVPEVLVRHEQNAPQVIVRVDTAERAFRVDDVDSPWALTARFE